MDAKTLIDEIHRKFNYDRTLGQLTHRETCGRGKKEA